ncbi:MAG TPA: sigma-70 family RNA polymerase sigma factor [Phycisphaerae bacterium]|nr:sigma-70 family RNA polymerase sigma factor [Phycisphaerae bacterium]HNU43705.1 sigma-70 family RNA polymerase sigma factor [Phycisphaerae bacterium]
MGESSSCRVTAVLRRVADGDGAAAQELFEAVYEELHVLAQRCFRRERTDHTLQATALVHEAYLKLVNQQGVRWEDRAHFFAVAARVMRHVLVNHARARKAAKRGGDRGRTPLSQVVIAADTRSLDLIALDEALKKLAALDERQSRIVELRFFGGLSSEEVAGTLGVSLRTVEGEWHLAKAWLLREIGDKTANDSGERQLK